MLALFRRPTLRLALVAFIVLSLQTTLVADMQPFGVTADLMLLGATAAGAVAGPQKGALAGFVFGFMFDLVLLTPFGMSALVYGLAGFLAGTAIHTWTADPTWWLTLVVVAATSALGVIGIAVASIFVGLDVEIPPNIIRNAIVIGCINGILAPLAMPIQRWCFRIKRVIA